MKREQVLIQLACKSRKLNFLLLFPLSGDLETGQGSQNWYEWVKRKGDFHRAV